MKMNYFMSLLMFVYSAKVLAAQSYTTLVKAENYLADVYDGYDQMCDDFYGTSESLSAAPFNVPQTRSRFCRINALSNPLYSTFKIRLVTDSSQTRIQRIIVEAGTSSGAVSLSYQVVGKFRNTLVAARVPENAGTEAQVMYLTRNSKNWDSQSISIYENSGLSISQSYAHKYGFSCVNELKSVNDRIGQSQQLYKSFGAEIQTVWNPNQSAIRSAMDHHFGSPDTCEDDDNFLKEYANKKARKVLVASVARNSSLISESNAESKVYSNILRSQFEMFTPETANNLNELHRNRPNIQNGRIVNYAYNYSDYAKFLDFSGKYHQQIKFQALLWHTSLPNWVNDVACQWRNEFIDNHIENVIGSLDQISLQNYNRRIITMWNVVNEAVSDNGGQYRASFWNCNRTDPESSYQYIKRAFVAAAKQAPDALLYYNDYNIENPDGGGKAKEQTVYNLISRLKREGVKIGGIGFQMHQNVENNGLTQAYLENLFNKYQALGLKVLITELDIGLRSQDGNNSQALAAQAKFYERVLQACLNVPACEVFGMWGFTDKHSWIPSVLPGRDHALIYDKNYAPKPAYFSLLNLLK